jgi:hypothetical protein
MNISKIILPFSLLLISTNVLEASTKKRTFSEAIGKFFTDAFKPASQIVTDEQGPAPETLNDKSNESSGDLGTGDKISNDRLIQKKQKLSDEELKTITSTGSKPTIGNEIPKKFNIKDASSRLNPIAMRRITKILTKRHCKNHVLDTLSYFRDFDAEKSENMEDAEIPEELGILFPVIEGLLAKINSNWSSKPFFTSKMIANSAIASALLELPFKIDSLSHRENHGGSNRALIIFTMLLKDYFIEIQSAVNESMDGGNSNLTKLSDHFIPWNGFVDSVISDLTISTNPDGLPIKSNLKSVDILKFLCSDETCSVLLETPPALLPQEDCNLGLIHKSAVELAKTLVVKAIQKNSESDIVEATTAGKSLSWVESFKQNFNSLIIPISAQLSFAAASWKIATTVLDFLDNSQILTGLIPSVPNFGMMMAIIIALSLYIFGNYRAGKYFHSFNSLQPAANRD